MWGLAACALLLLPGIMIVRSPWRFVPLLSVAFWLVVWTFTPAFGLPHTRLLGLALLASGTLALLRLLRIDASLPAPATLATAAGAALPLGLLWILPVAPGLVMPFHGAVTRLLEWRDGVPASYEPLLPFPHFVRAGFGLPALAADLCLLAHVSTATATLAVALIGEGLLVLALHALVAPRLSRGAAAVSSLSIPALAHLAGVLPVPGSSPLALALALACGAGACFWNGSTRSSAVAGAMMAVAALEVDAAMGLTAVPWLVAALATHPARDNPEARSRADRWRTAAVATLVFAAPLAPRVRDLAGAVRAGAGLATLAGVGIVALTALATAAVAHVRADNDRPVSVGARGKGLVVALVALLVLMAARVERRRAEDSLAAGPDDLAVLTWLEGAARRDDVLCPESPGALWAPAIAGLPARITHLPSHVAERAGPARDWRCTLVYRDRRALGPAGERPLFGSGSIRLFRLDTQPLTSFDSRGGNLLAHTP